MPLFFTIWRSVELLGLVTCARQEVMLLSEDILHACSILSRLYHKVEVSYMIYTPRAGGPRLCKYFYCTCLCGLVNRDVVNLL